MSRLETHSDRRISSRRAKREIASAPDAKDRLLVELELQQTRAQLQIEHLQKLQFELQDSRSRLEALYHNGPVGYVAFDEKGVVNDWNATAAEWLGSKRRMLLNVPFTLFVERKDTEIFLKHLVRCRRVAAAPAPPQGRQRGDNAVARQQVVSELRLKGTHGPLPVHIISLPFPAEGARYFQTAIIDLTERKKNEQELEEAREFSDTIIETIHEPLLVLDTSLRIVRANESFARLFAVSQPLTQGMLLDAVLNLWWEGNELRTRLEQTLARNVPLNNFEFKVQPRNLGRMILMFNARVLRHKEDSPPLLLVALEDITARKLAEEELLKSNTELQRLNGGLEQRVAERTAELRESVKRMESFCYSIAHDLRGPLRTMAGFSNILLDDFAEKLGERGKDSVERIVGAAQHMDHLIHDLLEYGRLNTVELSREPVEAEEVLNRVIRSQRQIIREKQACIRRKAKLPRVLANRYVLEAVFSHLLSNALKFVPPRTAPKVTIWPEKAEGQIRLWIADNGIGIEPQYQEKIFEVFQRLHSQSAYPGTGIGLAIVQRALQRIGGGVGVESEPGKGSRFWIKLPTA